MPRGALTPPEAGGCPMSSQPRGDVSYDLGELWGNMPVQDDAFLAPVPIYSGKSTMLTSLFSTFELLWGIEPCNGQTDYNGEGCLAVQKSPLNPREWNVVICLMTIMKAGRMKAVAAQNMTDRN